MTDYNDIIERGQKVADLSVVAEKVHDAAAAFNEAVHEAQAAGMLVNALFNIPRPSPDLEGHALTHPNPIRGIRCMVAVGGKAEAA